MGKYKKRLSANERYEVILPILENKISINQRSKNVNIGNSQIRRWIRKYKQAGMPGLENGKGWKKYSSDLKMRAIEDTLLHGMSKESVVKKYGLSESSVLRSWIKCYNEGKQLDATSSGRVGADIMTKGRKTTFEERIEIVNFCIAHDKDYGVAMKKYEVSYQQVYSWVQKYIEGGSESLQDRRGKAKAKEELSELELLKLENKRLLERNRYLEMENAVAKKLEELEYRYGHFR